MKWLWNAVWTLALTVIGGLLVYGFQDSVRDHLTGRSVIAEVYVGGWAPYPVGGRAQDGPRAGLTGIPAPTIARQTNSDFPFAMISVRNRGFTDANNVTLDMRREWGFDWLAQKKGATDPSDGLVALEADSFVIPTIKAGEEYRVFIWSGVDLDDTYSWHDLRFFSDKGPIAISVRSYEEIDGTFATPGFIRFIEVWAVWLISGAALSLFFVIVFWAAYVEAYNKKLFRDDDFYLAERIRFEADPKKFVADTKGLKLDT